ncbi:imidazole glycerol phosphate synthase subunit HisF [Flavobacterium rhizosphaerae]|uniref:Imidazole glycerol phosphate synthase subunit HisF n=1 Tax=Flavobacterium rhizosphaerae TaxID=3163298 RepID=A0ABW8YXU7_9FLAO
MLKKRIIPCLDIKNGRVVKGVNFIGLKDAGDPVALAKQYAREGADELVFLDITATSERRKTLAALVTDIAREINIPFTVGGGIKTVEEAAILLHCGADKISVNTSAVINPLLIQQIAAKLGSQAVVAAIDAKMVNNTWEVFINGGKTATGIELVSWARHVAEMGAGEILFTSMNSDGTKSGFELNALQAVCNAVNIPVIASGGAGTMQHFEELFSTTKASAALAASIFHFGEIPLPQLKNYLKQKNIPIR